MEAYMDGPNYLSTRQAAERYGLSESWLTKLRVYGTGPEHLKVGRRVLYERSVFENWLGSHRRRSTSESKSGPAARVGHASRPGNSLRAATRPALATQEKPKEIDHAEP